MYQRLQNLRQGTRSVDDYTTEFYQLIVRNDLQESQDHLVSRYCGGLRVQILEVVNLFDPVTVSEAHQRALQVEKTTSRRGGGGLFSFGSGSVAGRTVSTTAPVADHRRWVLAAAYLDRLRRQTSSHDLQEGCVVSAVGRLVTGRWIARWQARGC